MKGVSFLKRHDPAAAAVGSVPAILLLVFLSSCSIDPVPREFSYRVSVEIDSADPVAVDIDVSTPGGTNDSAEAGVVLFPWSHSFTGETEFTDAGGLPVLELVTVSVTGILSPGESYSVRIFYEELSESSWIRDAALIEPPVTRAHSGGAAPEAVSFLKVFAVPR